MSHITCLSCGYDNEVAQENCTQCGAALTTESDRVSPDAEEQLRRINESLAALNNKMRELPTLTRTTSFNGCGLMLLDYRSVDDGHYEATRWVTLFGFPLVPLSVWKILPHSYSQDARGEKQNFTLLGKRRITLDRILRPYLFLALGALPFVIAYFFVDISPAVYYVGRKLGSGVAVGLIIVLIILVLAWIGFIMTRFHNAAEAYKHKSA